MLKQMTDMPAGTIGFEAIGDVDDDDWEHTVEPVLRSEVAQGRGVRLLYKLGTAMHEVDSDAVKADLGFRTRHATSVERVAVVSDEDWIRPAMRTLSFLMPGKARAFHVRDLAKAQRWLTEGMER